MDRTEQRARIAENLAAVQSRIAVAAGDRPVRLVCVTKYARLDRAALLLDCGARILGENLLPAAAERFAQLRAEGYSFEGHLIGAQQSRKLRDIPGNFDCYQALDSMNDADELQRRLTDGQSLDVLLQVNMAAEEQKRGCGPDDVVILLNHVWSKCPALRTRGLMTIPPWPSAYESPAAFEAGSRGYFAQLKQLFDRIGSAGGPNSGVNVWDTLSMGMSQDYVWAIQEGATMVRVGSALFEGLED